MGFQAGVSPELLAAQKRLMRLRERKATTDGPMGELSNGRFPPTPLSPLQEAHNQLALLPNHLGWGSAPLTAVLRPAPLQKPQPPIILPPSEQPELTKTETKTAVIKLYADVAMGMLRHDQSAAGRIWLLLRQVDARGAGWVTDADAAAALTGRQSDLRVCGRRQLRNLLRQGEGVFWQRSQGRIWLASVARVATALGVTALRRQPVALPLTALTQGIGVVRAHFYASFHSSRQAKETSQQPIARATLGALTATTPKTQRTYEEKAGVIRQTNFAVGETYTADRAEEAGWRQGTGFFRLVDRKGRQGKPGAAYVAWQLPNSYRGPHMLLARGQQKKINRQLIDLFMQGMTGNDQAEIDICYCSTRRYFSNGRLALRHLSHTTTNLYWRPASDKHHRHKRIWHVIGQRTGVG